MLTVRQIPVGSCRTVVDVLRQAAELNADLEAYVEPAVDASHQRRSLTFAQWDRQADVVAGWLAGLGVGRGDVVCLVLPSSIDYAVAYAGVMRLGAVTSGVNPRLGPVEIESIIARTAPVLTIVDRTFDVDVSGSGQVADRTDLAATIAAADTTDRPAPGSWPTLEDTDAVAVVWTSGTTGVPKGAVFDHRALAAVAAGTDVLSHPGDRRLSPLPFAHVGYMTRAWDEIAHGITTVITPTPWQAAEALRIMEAERITVAQGVPTQWALLAALDDFDRADLSSLRIAATGGAPMAASLVADLRRRLGVPVVVRYTSTETSLGTGTVPDDRDEVVATTVGRPVPGVELAVVDDAGDDVPSGVVGRVRIRSAAVLNGYWRDVRARPAADSGTQPSGSSHLIDAVATTAVLDAEGWVTTGDFGSLSPDGNLRLAGRANELYVRGGYNVYPAEAETVLSSHPSVGRAAVIGTPHEVLGEVGVAFVELAGPVDAVDAAPSGHDLPTPEMLRRWCEERLTDYKVPEVVVVLDALPLTPMLKVDRRALAEPAELASAEVAALRLARRQ